MKILRQRRDCESVSYMIFFERRDCPGAGYSFPCSEDGTVDESKLQPAGRANLARARGEEARTLHEPRIDRVVSRWVEPRVGLCECGCEVELDRFTNVCERCHRDYNSAGQELAPREQWGEETGEYLGDILRVDGMSEREVWGEE